MMNERLGWRMAGAVCLLQASNCSREGAKYPDATLDRGIFVAGTLVCLYLAYRAWRREMSVVESP